MLKPRTRRGGIPPASVASGTATFLLPSSVNPVKVTSTLSATKTSTLPNGAMAVISIPSAVDWTDFTSTSISPNREKGRIGPWPHGGVCQVDIAEYGEHQADPLCY